MRPLLPSLLLLFASALAAEETKPDPRIARDDAFPDPAGAKRLSGELILVEQVNRLGILRPDRDGTINNYHWDLPHEFRMLPYGAIWYRGAPAELDDVPLGTHLHGLLYLGPEGDFEVKPPESGYFAGRAGSPDMRSVESKWSQVLRFEDDFSYFSRLGHGWKIADLSPDKTTVTVVRVSLADGAPVDEKSADDGAKGRQALRIDEGTAIWKGRGIASLGDLAVDQVVQINFTWVGLLGSTKEDGMCREIWIDEESRRVASERQRQIHRADLKRRGLPATILKTESMPGEGARGHVAFAFHEGIDPELIAAFQPKSATMVWAVEPSLRVYDALNDTRPFGDLEIRTVENPPPGHSGVEVRAHCWEMLEGFRAGRSIRIALRDWAPPERPREERLWPVDTRRFSVGPRPVADREAETEVADEDQ